MLIWGSGSKVVELGPSGQAHCSTCEKERAFKNVLTFRYAHIWYLFRWVTKRSYATICDVCSRGTPHDTKTYEAEHGKSAIPAYYRYGLWTLLGLAAVFIAFVVAAGMQSDRREAQLLQQPQVGDMYLVRLDKMVPDDFDGIGYGLMRVAAVDDGGVALQIPNYGYNKRGGVRKDLRSGAAADTDYFSEDTLQLSLDELRKQHGPGIYDIQR
ncbi:hypothetical protein [Luteimonas salinilitoris]|uniref:Zinc-ribbon domain-containing protein n=1 Tax=Luteimonas salinilitoris TaxID=3237697 RepID=A0ABV4HSS2_9GAMM